MMPLAMTLMLMVMVTPRPGRGVPVVVRRTAGDAVVGGVAGQCDNHEGKSDKGGR
jgi:hypothetical protein